VTDPRSAAPGGLRLVAAPGGLRLVAAPPGLPDPNVAPPVVAEPGDAFAVLRVLELVARVERGRPVLLDDLVASLNARYLDWLFDRAVIADALVALQANWMADFRNASGIVLEDSPYGPALRLEDTARVSGWLVGQAQRAAAECRRQLAEFSRRDEAPGSS
jgi:hypothetical protein